MALRLSFTLDSVLSERIDQFAKKQELDRNEAVLLLIEHGLDLAAEEGIVEPIRDRDYKKEARMQKNIWESRSGRQMNPHISFLL